jgi:hypothetical protein
MKVNLYAERIGVIGVVASVPGACTLLEKSRSSSLSVVSFLFANSSLSGI